jgi:hypothetical protein
MPVRRLARLLVALSLLVVSFAVPASSAAAPFAFARHVLGSVAGSVTRAYAVPRGALLAGVTWGSGELRVSVLGSGDLENDPRELGGRPGTEPYWLPPGVRVLTLSMTGDASDVRVDFAGAGTPAKASSSGPPRSWELPRLGTVVTRPGWGADERWRSGGVAYMTPRAMVVHHTVTRNDYTAAEAPGLVRAVYAYHTKSRGWDDIGYNVVVDRFGTVYEGRYGGFPRGVIGTHTAGFNDSTLGISLLGNFDEVDTPEPMAAALGRAGAWFAERWGLDPRTRVTLTSDGSPRFPRGARVTVYRMPGHRDLGKTACPGRYAYGRLAAVRTDAWRRLRAVYSTPVVTGAPVRSPEPVTVSATLDHTAWWRATISTEDGTDILAHATGRGTQVNVSWNGVLTNGLPALPGMRFAYRLTADDGVHGVSEPVAGTFEGGVPKVATAYR